MLYNDRIYIYVGIVSDKTNSSYKYKINYYSYSCFFRINFCFQPNVCDDCHDLSGIAANFNETAIGLVK